KTTRFVSGSIRLTDPLCSFAAQTAPYASTTPEGASPTGMRATTLLVFGSIRRTVFAPRSVIQRPFGPAAKPPGSVALSVMRPAAPLVVGLILNNCLPPLVAQIAPAPA